MSQPLALSISVIVSLVLSTSISVVMLKPLRGVLNQLCPGSHATNFWMSFTTVMLYVTALLFTLLFVGTVMGAPRVIAVWSLRGSFDRGLPNFSCSPIIPLDRCS
jgi:hypothetical protein